MICRRPTWRGSDVISALVCVSADSETAGQFSSKLLAYCQQPGKLQNRSLQNYWLIAYPVTWQIAEAFTSKLLAYCVPGNLATAEEEGCGGRRGGNEGQEDGGGIGGGGGDNEEEGKKKKEEEEKDKQEEENSN